MARSSSKTPVTAMPTSRNGSRTSQTIGYRMSARSASGQHSDQQDQPEQKPTHVGEIRPDGRERSRLGVRSLMDRNRRLRPVRRAVTILLCATILGAMWIIARSPAILEAVYAQGVGFQIARLLSRATGLLPFSLAEIALAGVVAYVVVPFVVRHHPRRSTTAAPDQRGGFRRAASRDGDRCHPRLLLSVLGSELRAGPAGDATGMAASRDDRRAGRTPASDRRDREHGGGARRGGEHGVPRSERQRGPRTPERTAGGRAKPGQPCSTPRLPACSSVLGAEPALAAARGRAKPIAHECAHELSGARRLLLSVDRRGELQPSDAGALAATLGRARESAPTRHCPGGRGGIRRLSRLRDERRPVCAVFSGALRAPAARR